MVNQYLQKIANCLIIKATFKQLIAVLCLLLGQLFFSAPATAQNKNVDNTKPYELLVPNLDVLHTNMVFSREDQLQKTFYNVDKDGTCTIVGDIVTFDTLTKYITSDIFKNSDWRIDTKLYLDDNIPVIKHLKIYCDSFDLRQPLWFPGVNVLIHSRVINFYEMEAEMLKTDPRPWREVKNATVAKNGADAGKIEIICKTYLGKTRPRLSARGADGTGVKFAQVSFKPYSTIRKIWAQSGGLAPSEKEANHCSWEYDLSSDYIGILYKYDLGWQFRGMPGTSIGDGTYTDVFMYEKSGQLYDGSASTRLNWKDSKDRTAGKGGKGANISVLCEDPKFKIRTMNDFGFEGAYYAPDKTASETEVSVGCNTNSDGIITGGIKINEGKQYYSQALTVTQIANTNKVSECVFKYIYQTNTKTTYNISELKTLNGANAVVDFNNHYKDYYYLPPSHTSSLLSTTQKKYAPSELYLRHKLILEKNKIKDYQSLSPKDSAEVSINFKKIEKNIAASVGVYSEELENVTVALENATKKLKDITNKDSIKFYEDRIISYNDNKKFYSFKLAEAQKLQGELALAAKNVKTKRFVDEFNNPLGYRPVLSFTAIKQFMESNIDADLQLYIGANDAMKSINDKAAFLKNIPELCIKLDTAVNKGYRELTENTTRMKELGEDGEILATSAKFLNDSLVKLEIRLRKQAKKESDNEKFLRIGAKVLAVGAACGATAFGGPAAGAATYGLVDKLSAGALDSEYENKESNAKAVQTDINVAPLFNYLKDKKLEPINNKLADFEYRKNNKLFEKFDSWEPKDDDNFLSVKYPDALEDYLNAKKRFENKAEEIKKSYENKSAMASFAVKGAGEIYSAMVSTSMLDNAINRVVSQSPEFREMGEAIKYNASKYGDFETRLRSTILERGEIADKIGEFSRQKYQLNLIKSNPEAYIDPLLANSIASMETESLKRLKWMEYQFMKVYNYTTLEAYPASSVSNYRLLFSKELGAKTADDRLKSMSAAYKNYLQNIKAKIAEKASTDAQQDSYGVDMFIGKDSKILQTINDENTYTIDLYNDFNDAVIQPDKNNIRILSLSLNEFGLSRTLQSGESVQLTIELDDKGILRKDDKFYFFRDDAKSIAKWTWNFSAPAKKSNDQATVSVSENSKYYDSILDAILGEKGDKAVSKYKFTLKSAWTKMKISVTQTNVKEGIPIQFDSLRFKIQRDYENVKSKQNVCDLRVNSEDTDVRMVITKGANKPDTVSHSQYNVFTKNEKVSLTAYSIDKTRAFSHWETVPLGLAKKAKENVLEFDVNLTDVNGNVRVKPVFVSIPPKGLLIDAAETSVKNINLYKSPKLSSEAALTIPFSYLKKLNIEETEPNGFKRVIYGLEEYFVNAKDLE